jgi:hypothetical protein
LNNFEKFDNTDEIKNNIEKLNLKNSKLEKRFNETKNNQNFSNILEVNILLLYLLFI